MPKLYRFQIKLLSNFDKIWSFAYFYQFAGVIDQCFGLNIHGHVRKHFKLSIYRINHANAKTFDLNDLKIWSFSGIQKTRISHVSVLLWSTFDHIFIVFGAQLRKSNGAKHSPLSSWWLATLRVKFQNFAEIWSFAYF